MPPHSRFETELPHAHWPVRYSELVQSGTTRRALGGGSWRRVARGLLTPTVEEVTVTQRILDTAAQLPPAAAIAGWAAAYVWGVDELDGIDPRTGKELPVDCVSRQLRRRATPAIRYHRTDLADPGIVDRAGIAVTDPLTTALDGARWAPSLEESVVFLDALIRFGLLTEDELRRAVGKHRCRTGVARLRHAVELSEAGVRSGWESRLRMCYRLEAGLPRPAINVPIFSDTEDFLGIADLFDPVAGLVSEYDGDQHLDRHQHHHDTARVQGFQSVNLTVVQADSLDLNVGTGLDRRPFIRRLLEGYRRGCRRDPGRDRWTTTTPEWWLGRIPGA